jgi:hypothetical protein
VTTVSSSTRCTRNSKSIFSHNSEGKCFLRSETGGDVAHALVLNGPISWCGRHGYFDCQCSRQLFNIRNEDQEAAA